MSRTAVLVPEQKRRSGSGGGRGEPLRVNLRRQTRAWGPVALTPPGEYARCVPTANVDLSTASKGGPQVGVCRFAMAFNSEREGIDQERNPQCSRPKPGWGPMLERMKGS